MPRPIKWRKVENLPEYRYFIPTNVDSEDLEENILKIEELEAIRLRDLQGLEQEECANKMKISRQTFQRVYNEAKAKVADSLVNGKAIKVSGGNFTQNICTLVCRNCGFKWEKRVEELREADQRRCPQCGSLDCYCESDENDVFCNRRCRRRKWCCRNGK